MKNLIVVLTVFTSVSLLNSCGGKEEEKKKLTVCDCLEDGKVKQTDECREIAGSATADEMEKCK